MKEIIAVINLSDRLKEWRTSVAKTEEIPNERGWIETVPIQWCIEFTLLTVNGTEIKIEYKSYNIDDLTSVSSAVYNKFR